MTLFSVYKQASLRFQIMEALRDNRYPSAALSVWVDDGGFSGSVRIWVGADEWNAFVGQLEECERLRRGSATLQSMSPDEFSLRIESGDSLGHFVVRYALLQRDFLRIGSVARTLCGGFDLDSELLRQIVSGFVRFDALPDLAVLGQ